VKDTHTHDAVGRRDLFEINTVSQDTSENYTAFYYRKTSKKLLAALVASTGKS